MIILGLDPGTAKTGYGLIKKNKSSQLTLIGYGCIRTKQPFSAAERLKQIQDQLTALIKKYSPDKIAVEKIFFYKNLKTVIGVSQARGVLLATAAQNKLLVEEYTPLQVKQAVASYGRAEKKQIQKMVKTILGLKTIPDPSDAADALAIAICCAHSSRD